MESTLKGRWAVILGGSSGFGLATAKKLAEWGMNICVVHRDRKGAMARIEPEFERIRACGVTLKTFNLDALSREGRETVIHDLEQQCKGQVRLLLHSIAFGNLKLVAPQKLSDGSTSASAALASALGVDPSTLQGSIDELFRAGEVRLSGIATPPVYNNELMLEDEELSTTIFAMGTSLLSWTRDMFRQGLFASDARVIGLTSEGNELAWRGYAAVSAAKVALESISRSIAKEFAPYGIRSNIVQPGVTDTPALRLIPGNEQLRAHAQQKNPFGRLTTVEDVAGVIALLTTDEAQWINGSLIRVDGGEKISG